MPDISEERLAELERLYDSIYRCPNVNATAQQMTLVGDALVYAFPAILAEVRRWREAEKDSETVSEADVERTFSMLGDETIQAHRNAGCTDEIIKGLIRSGSLSITPGKSEA